jgi:hypothetical protein
MKKREEKKWVIMRKTKKDKGKTKGNVIQKS